MEVSLPQIIPKPYHIIDTKKHTKTACSSRVSVQYI